MPNFAQLETVHGGAQTKIKTLEEEKRGLEEERRNLLQQLQKASEDHTSHVNEQLKLYQSDFEKERAEREKLLMKYDTLEEMLSEANAMKVSLQKEMTALAARHQEVSAAPQLHLNQVMRDIYIYSPPSPNQSLHMHVY